MWLVVLKYKENEPGVYVFQDRREAYEFHGSFSDKDFISYLCEVICGPGKDISKELVSDLSKIEL